MQWAVMALLGTLLGGVTVPPESIIPANAQQAARYYQQTGDALASWGAMEAALRNYRKALEKDPKSSTVRLHTARAMASMGLVLPALQQVQVVLKAEPQDRDAGILYSQLVLQSGKAREAELAVRPVVERHANDAEAHRVLGITLFAQKKLPAAAEQFRLAARSNPEDAEAYKLLAQAQLAQEQTAEAVVTLQKYLTLRPGDLQVALIMADVLVSLGRHAEALALGLRLVKAQPDNPQLMMGLASELMRAGRRDEAASFYVKVLQLTKDPRMLLPAANFLAEYSAMKRRYGDAAGYLRRVIALQPALLPPRLMLVRMYTLAGNWGAAAGAARAVAALNPANLGLRMQVFDLQLRAGLNSAAAQTADAIVRRWPADPGVAQTLAGGLVRAGQASRALRLLEQARRRFPQVRPLGYLLYQLYRTLGRHEAAVGLLEALLKATPDDPLVRHELAGEAFEKQRYERVVDLLEPLARRNMVAPDAIFALAWSLEKAGRHLDAAGLYQGYAMGRNQPTLLLHVARQFEAIGDAESAMRVFKKILESEPKHVPTLVAMGRLLGNTGQFAEAAATFERVAAMQPDNPFVWRSLGLAYTALEMPLAAEAAYRQVARIDPGDDYAVAKVGQVQAEQHELDQAIETWLAGLQQHPDSAVLHRVLAEAYKVQGDYPEAIAHYTAAVRAEPADFTTLLAGAMANEQVGLFGEARAWYRDLLEAGPETTFVYRRWLETFDDEGTPELGLQAGLQLLSRRPGSDLLADAVMEQAARTGQLGLLGSQLDRILPSKSHEPGWQDLQGRRLMATGDLSSAATYYGQLSREAPADSRWRLRAGEVAAASGDLTAARRQFEAASRLNPQDPEPLRELTEAQIAAGRDDDAMLTLRRLMNLAPQDPAGFERLVRLYDEQGRVAVVRDGLRELMTAPPPRGKAEYRENPAILVAYGLACELAGQPVEAADAYQKALKLNSHQLTARLGLRRVTSQRKAPQPLGPAR